MLKIRDASPDPCRTPILRRGDLLRLPFAVVRVRLRLPTSMGVRRNFSRGGQSRHFAYLFQAVGNAMLQVRENDISLRK